MPNQQILKNLPKLIRNHFSQPILQKHSICVIGYGSGVFPQTSKPTNNTIDIIMIVKNRHNFHKEMHSYQRNDYAGLPKYLGSQYLNTINDIVFPAHFNHVTIGNNNKLKYAVIDLNTFMYDLHTWRLLTFAGRLHKPVLFNILQQSIPQILTKQIKNNHKYALSVTLLKMISKIKVNQYIPINILYNYLSTISYIGDIRYTVNIQNNNKVTNIVNNNLYKFNQIYIPLIQQLKRQLIPGTIEIDKQKNSIKIKYTPQLIDKLINKDKLPQVLYNHFSAMSNTQNYKSLTQKLLMDGISNIPRQIQSRLSKINRYSSIKMAIQNFLGASFVNNVNYMLAKVNKKKLK